MKLTRMFGGALVVFAGMGLLASVASAEKKEVEIPSDLGKALKAKIADLDAREQAALYLLLQGMPTEEAAPAKGAKKAPAKKKGAKNPKQAVLNVIKAYSEAAANKDIEGSMAYVADDFEHYEYGDKEGLKQFMVQAKDMGYLEGLEVILDNAEVEIEDGKAVVYPIDVTGAFGSVTFEYVLERKDGKWRITGLEGYGL